ncbi:helix-turn-helix domain-containing protein [Saccharomonospora azurea]|uniref:helix-turn-helix domain-containing protein n=1 Tax=Saccharomonospora azurea TaxID=40988 RepID=UPI0033220D28
MTSEFGAQLRRRRREAGLTQDQLAERSGVGVRTIRGFETGERAAPRMATVRLLAEALELSPAERDALVSAAVGTTASGEPSPDPTPEPQPGLRSEVVESVAISSDGSGVGTAVGTGPHSAPESPRFPESLLDAAEQLAQEARSRWQREEEQRQVHDPFPLPVRWRSARDDVADHDENVYNLGLGQDEPMPRARELSGSLADVGAAYRALPSGRLVVLGRAGSGKTVLTLRFALGLLKGRQRTDPVPVIVGLGSWNPADVSLRDWLAGQLERDYPGLAATSYGSTSLAAALVEAGLVLPVLDGFDEIADGLRQSALRELNGTMVPFLLTSRPAEYVAAVDALDVLTSAAVIELCDLTVSDLARYLPRTARKTRSGTRSTTVWDSVLAELADNPDSRACANLATVLANPLMVGLARAVYSDQPGRDPGELLDSRRFPTADALESHLFDNFVPTAYQDRPGSARSRWDVRRVPYWLGYLARHLDRLGTRDLAWWQLGDTIGKSMRMLVVGVLTGTIIGLVQWLGYTLLRAVLRGGDAAFDIMFGLALLDMLHVGLASGLAFALVHGLVLVFGTALEPARSRIGFRRGEVNVPRTFAARFRIGLLGGVVFGLLSGLIWGAVSWLLSGEPDMWIPNLINGVVFAIVFGPSAGLAYGIVGMFQTSLDIRSISRPGDLLGLNRMTVLTQLGMFAPLFGLIVGLGSAPVVDLLQHVFGRMLFGPSDALLWGGVGMVGGGLGYVLCMTAWGQWVVFARFWLPLTGRLPWAVAAFLDDAYRRGVLRQAGAVYQFRHARLHDHLARVFEERDNA